MMSELKKDLELMKNIRQAKVLSGFFKTGKGEYGEGDQFLGIKVPELRIIARNYKDLPLKELQSLLNSRIHEYRLTALFILVGQYEKADGALKKNLVDFYLKNTGNVNNWDLVDLTAPKILGDYLLKNDRKVLYKLAKSRDLWEKRIAMLACLALINNKDFDDALRIAEILIDDKHDLIHKAVGWMLREIGKRDQAVEEKFLQRYYTTMPRTMLRYAIERFEEKKRMAYLQG